MGICFSCRMRARQDKDGLVGRMSALLKNKDPESKQAAVFRKLRSMARKGMITNKTAIMRRKIGKTAQLNLAKKTGMVTKRTTNMHRNIGKTARLNLTRKTGKVTKKSNMHRNIGKTAKLNLIRKTGKFEKQESKLKQTTGGVKKEKKGKVSRKNVKGLKSKAVKKKKIGKNKKGKMLTKRTKKSKLIERRVKQAAMKIHGKEKYEKTACVSPTQNGSNMVFNGVVQSSSANGAFVLSTTGLSIFAPYEIQTVPADMLKVHQKVIGTIVCSDFSLGRFIATVEPELSENESFRCKLKSEFNIEFPSCDSEVSENFSLGSVHKFTVSEIGDDGSLEARDCSAASKNIGTVPAFLSSRVCDSWKHELGETFEAVVVGYKDDFKNLVLAPAIMENGFTFTDKGVHEVTVVCSNWGISIGLCLFSNKLICFKPMDCSVNEESKINKKVFVRLRLPSNNSNFCLADEITETDYLKMSKSSEVSLRCKISELVQKLTDDFPVGTVVKGKIVGFEAAFVCVSLSAGTVTGKIFMEQFKEMRGNHFQSSQGCDGSFDKKEREKLLGKFVAAVVCGYLTSPDGSDCSLLLITPSSTDQVPETFKYFEPMRFDTNIVCVKDLMFLQNVDTLTSYIEKVETDSITVRVFPFLCVRIPNIYIGSNWKKESDSSVAPENIGAPMIIKCNLVGTKENRRCLAVDADLYVWKYRKGHQICLHKFEGEVFYGLNKISVKFLNKAEKKQFSMKPDGFQFVATVVSIVKRVPRIIFCQSPKTDCVRRLPRELLTDFRKTELKSHLEKAKPEVHNDNESLSDKTKENDKWGLNMPSNNLKGRSKAERSQIRTISESRAKVEVMKDKLTLILGDQPKNSERKAEEVVNADPSCLETREVSQAEEALQGEEAKKKIDSSTEFQAHHTDKDNLKRRKTPLKSVDKKVIEDIINDNQKEQSEITDGKIDASWSDDDTDYCNVVSKKPKNSENANLAVSLENYENHLQSLNNSPQKHRFEESVQPGVDQSVVEKLQLAVKADARSCKHWLSYIEYYIQLSDIANVREICRKAVDSIDDLKYDDKLQVWTRLLDSEVKLGTAESVQETFDLAIQRNNPLQTHFVMADIWQDHSNFSKAVETYKLAIKKFKSKKEAWLKYLEFLFKNRKFSDAAELVSASFASLTKQEHVEIILKKSQFEFKYGEVERGKTNIEHLLSTYPKRIDIWSEYMQCLISAVEYEEVRSVFSRVLTLDLRPFKLKPLFKLYLHFEKTYGTSELFQKWSGEFDKRFNSVEANS